MVEVVRVVHFSILGRNGPMNYLTFDVRRGADDYLARTGEDG